jgi:hypothetical protein
MNAEELYIKALLLHRLSPCLILITCKDPAYSGLQEV